MRVACVHRCVHANEVASAALAYCESGHIAPAIWRISSSVNLSSHHRRIASVTRGAFAPYRHLEHLGLDPR